jgi:hypothetical protein
MRRLIHTFNIKIIELIFDIFINMDDKKIQYLENNISKFYPILDTGTIMDTVLLRNAASDVSFLKDSSSWVDSYQKIRKSGLRYRATMDDCKRPFNDVYNLSHSNICKRVFY